MLNLIFKTADKPVTPELIRKVLGPLDDDLVSAVKETGATTEDLRRAYACFDDEDVNFVMDRPMNHRMRRVYDILQDDMDRMQRFQH